MTKFQQLKSRLRSEYPDQKDALDAAAAIEELEEALRPFADQCEILEANPASFGVFGLHEALSARTALGETK